MGHYLLVIEIHEVRSVKIEIARVPDIEHRVCLLSPIIMSLHIGFRVGI